MHPANRSSMAAPVDDVILDNSIHEVDGDFQAEIVVKRKAITIAQKHQQYQFIEKEQTGILKTVAKYVDSWLVCSSVRIWGFLWKRIPALKWMPVYRYKNHLLHDVLSGTTVAIMNIPQGMGYALLAGVSPINGLYTAIFPVLLYAFFGTSRHISIGVVSVVCLMTGELVDRIAVAPSTLQATNYTTNDTLDVETNMTGTGATQGFSPIEVAAVLSFTVGSWEFIFAFLQLGFVCVLLSDMLISGFTTGVAVHILTSQIKYLLGITVPRHKGMFKLIFLYYDIFRNIGTANVASIITSLICIVILVFTSDFVKPRVRKYTKMPVPIELLMVMMGTLISYLGSFHENFAIQIVGPVPTGLPNARLPRLELFGELFMESVTMAIVAFALSYSLARIYAKKKEYSVDATQELYAQGFSNMFGSVFSCVPVSASLPRTAIQVDTGGMTQVASLVNCCIMLVVVLLIAPIFQSLPHSILASIIVVSIKETFLQVRVMLKMWNKSRMDAVEWVITFLSVVILNIEFGLYIGIGVSVIVLVLKSQRQLVKRLGRIPNTDIYLSIEEYSMADELPGFRICQFSGLLHFANCETFYKQVVSASEINPKEILKQGRCSKRKDKEKSWANDVKRIDHRQFHRRNRQAVQDYFKEVATGVKNMNQQVNLNKYLRSNRLIPVRWLILDLSGICSIDFSASMTIVQLSKDYGEIGINFILTGISEQVMNTLKRSGAFATISEEGVFHSVHDAICTLSHRDNIFYTKA